MIFVTLGTQNFNFLRLLQSVEQAIKNGTIQEKVVAQIGNNDFNSPLMECVGFLDKESFQKNMEEARFIISHAGTGSIITALKKQKKVLVAARLKAYHEHIDNHQLELLEAFTRLNLIIPLSKDLRDLEEKILHIEDYQLDTYESNTTRFNQHLTELINNL